MTTKGITLHLLSAQKLSQLAKKKDRIFIQEFSLSQDPRCEHNGCIRIEGKCWQDTHFSQNAYNIWRFSKFYSDSDGSSSKVNNVAFWKQHLLCIHDQPPFVGRARQCGDTKHVARLHVADVFDRSDVLAVLLHAACRVHCPACRVHCHISTAHCLRGPKVNRFPKAVNSFIWLADSLIYVISIAMRLMASFALGDWVNASVK